MTTLQPFPKFRAFDADGNPLSGGLVYSYAAGTSTPMDTYTDNTLDNPNENPVELDSSGQADIWYGNAMYKLALFDANGVLQWTVDNIGTVNAATTTGGGFGAATDIESGSLVDLGTIASHFANITGTTQIDSFGTSASIDAPIYLIKFEGALTLKNSANLFLPGSEDVVTGLNDRALVEYLGSGAWRVFSYMRADGTALVVNAITQDISFTGVISPTTLVANTNDWAPTDFATASVIRISSSAAINLTGIAAGTIGRTLFLENVGTFPILITNDATSTAANRFFCPLSQDYALVPNGSVILQYDATSSRWRVAAGTPSYKTGQIVQSAYGSIATIVSGTSVVPQDNTIPQISETTAVITASITPFFASSTLRITAFATGSTAASVGIQPFIFRDAGVSAISSGNGNVIFTNGTNIPFTITLGTSVAATATTSTTIRFHLGLTAATTFYVNGNSAGTGLFGGTQNAWIKVEEIAA